MLINRRSEQPPHSQLVCGRQERHTESQGNEPRQLCDEGSLLVVGEGEMLEQSQGQERTNATRGTNRRGLVPAVSTSKAGAPHSLERGARRHTEGRRGQHGEREKCDGGWLSGRGVGSSRWGFVLAWEHARGRLVLYVRLVGYRMRGISLGTELERDHLEMGTNQDAG